MEGLDGGMVYVEWRGPGNRCRGWPPARRAECPSSWAPSGPGPPSAGGRPAAGFFFPWRGGGRQKYCHGRPRPPRVRACRGRRPGNSGGGAPKLAGSPPRKRGRGRREGAQSGRPRASPPKYRGRVTGAPVCTRPPWASVAALPTSQVATAGSLVPRARPPRAAGGGRMPFGQNVGGPGDLGPLGRRVA